jgi:hypothetical protein
MSTKPFFSGRIPQDLFDVIEQRTKETGESKTQILIQALAAYTGFDLSDTPKGSDHSLKQKVELLSAEIETIKARLKEIESFQDKQDQKPTQIENIPIQAEEISKYPEHITPTINSLPVFPDNDKDNIVDKKKTANAQILNTKDATKLVGIKSNATIPAWYRDGQLPKTINGKTIRFNHKEKIKGFFWKVTVEDESD